MIDHGGERSRLSGARGAHDQHQAALGHHDLFEGVRQAELREVGNLVGNGADHHADILLLNKHIHPETRDARQRDGEIALQLFRELLASDAGS